VTWFNDRRYALRRAAAMLVAGPGAFCITALLTASALALPLFVGVLGYSALPLFPRLQQAAGAEASIFLASGTASRELEALQSSLSRVPGVAAIRLIPKDQALADLAKRNGVAFSGTDRANPLPDVLVARFAAGLDGAAIERAIEGIRALPGVDRVRADIDWYRRGRTLAVALASVVVVLTGFVAVLVFLVMIAATREQANLRRDEIAVMRLCGASPAFMARPSIYLSAFAMGCGAVLAAAAVMGAVGLVRPSLVAMAQLIGQPFDLRLPPLWTAVALLVAAIVFGAAAGWVGTRRSVAQLRS
jgi:cell division transport system permease protein